MADMSTGPDPDDALEWLLAQAREIEQRISSLMDAAARLGEERLAAARAAAEAIVNAALREAEDIRRAATLEASEDTEPEAPSAASSIPRAAEHPGAPFRPRVFVGGDDIEGARRLAEELVLGGLGRARIDAELAARFPELGAERIEAIIRALLVPPSAAHDDTG
jgi:hypothetical protein